MKYMLLTFGTAEELQETKPLEWIKEMVQFMGKLNSDLIAAGELIDAQGLADGPYGKTVRFIDGAPVPTDGPFAETRECLAGYWVVDVENEARALEIASRVVAFIEGPIEVRQVMDGPPPEFL